MSLRVGINLKNEESSSVKRWLASLECDAAAVAKLSIICDDEFDYSHPVLIIISFMP